jgi:hypothetical protein
MCFVTPIKNRDRLAVKLVGPAGEVPVAGYGGSNVDRSRDRDWHTVVQGFKIGKLIGIVFNKLGEAAEQTSSLWCLCLAPRSLFERCPGAALTAFSTSAASASETWQISAPVARSMLAKVSPDSLAIQRLLIKGLVAETATRRSEGCNITEVI